MTVEDVVITGWLKKLKTKKRRFYALTIKETAYEKIAELSCYKNEKLFMNKRKPSHTLNLIDECISIDTLVGHVHTIAIFTISQNIMAFICADNNEAEKWLHLLRKVRLQCKGEKILLSSTFINMWQVEVVNKIISTGEYKKMKTVTLPAPIMLKLIKNDKKSTVEHGDYRLGLTAANIIFMATFQSKSPSIILELSNVRKLGHFECYFLVTTGNASTMGSGEICMKTDSCNTAQDMHNTILFTLRRSFITTNVGDYIQCKDQKTQKSKVRGVDYGKFHTMPPEEDVSPKEQMKYIDVMNDSSTIDSEVLSILSDFKLFINDETIKSEYLEIPQTSTKEIIERSEPNYKPIRATSVLNGVSDNSISSESNRLPPRLSTDPCMSTTNNDSSTENNMEMNFSTSAVCLFKTKNIAHLEKDLKKKKLGKFLKWTKQNYEGSIGIIKSDMQEHETTLKDLANKQKIKNESEY
ncbi:hypothetical protein A3Q56_01471 [Intoshia linei]|uniref:Insulin receptor substrate 1 n=1 Tax=Intoshia linei TaxID=1819745 RepID=A0A177B9D3_9BILA|nr:hypothetical protein A3Q56_01471 [Intoshia linei]